MSIDMLEAGSWSCPQCEESNSDFHDRCRNCGAARLDNGSDIYEGYNIDDEIDDLSELGGDSGSE